MPLPLYPFLNPERVICRVTRRSDRAQKMRPGSSSRSGVKGQASGAKISSSNLFSRLTLHVKMLSSSLYRASLLLPSSLSPNYPNGSRPGLLIVTISRADNSTNHQHQQEQDTFPTSANQL